MIKIKLSRFDPSDNLYASFQRFFSYQKTIELTVSKIISNHKRDPNFLYQNTKQVSQTISILFKDLPKNQFLNLQQLNNLFKNIHLSGFSSWKTLRQTSLTIQNVLNQQLSQRKQKIQPLNLSSLLHVLSSLNYELEAKQDRPFLNYQIFQAVNFDSIELNIEGLRIIQAFSFHSVVFSKLIQERRNFPEQMMKLVEKCIKNQDDRLQNYFTANIIKNAIYQNKWSAEFLKSLQKILSSKQSLEMNLKGLLDAIQLNNISIKSIKQDKWSLSQPHNSESNILTEIRIAKILKQMDYDVQPNQSLFNYEVDSKIGDKFIVEYHGIHHYRTNSNKPIETNKSYWKVQALKNRGYKVFVIPFYTWNRLQTTYQKKAWLIENLQHHFNTQYI